VEILVIGQGAREHAIVRTLLKDDGVIVHCAPGNPGIARDVTTHPVDATNSESVVALAQFLDVDLVVIGPEAPLVAGVADALRAADFAVFGPSGAAAQLEGSKAFAKEIMKAANVPTADAHLCTTVEQASAALDEFGSPYVVKDDGLAAGKGVVVTDDRDIALAHAQACITSRDGGAVVIEEYLDGPEVSMFGITDGSVIVPLSPAQDFKRVADNDEGPNTGGMGAYTPLPWAPDNLVSQVHATVLQPMIDEMAKRGTPFAGLLYAGLALTSRGVKVIEFNARFGDPETQVVLARLNSPLSQILYLAATESLSAMPELEWKNESAVTVVMAAQGYPDAPVLGARISGIQGAEVAGADVFHAGTTQAEEALVVSGGRVLSVTASGIDLNEARAKAYSALEHISFSGSHNRSDIALKAALGEVHIS
jgi:phosphoribosylamine--glycine ligase